MGIISASIVYGSALGVMTAAKTAMNRMALRRHCRIIWLETTPAIDRKMREWRRGAILIIAVFAAVITPSADPYTMLAMLVPMVLFYEAAIIVARLLKR